MYKVNRLKAMLQEGKVPVGIMVTLDSSSIAEAMAHAGFDFLILDMEHMPTNPETMHHMVQATRGTNAAPVIRVPWNEQWVIKGALDMGAYGVMVPQVSTREEALAAVRAVKYAPEGERGVGPFCAALRWGMTLPEYVAVANEEIVLMIQVETPQGVENVEEILSVPGIDVVFSGPGDLAVSMGGLHLVGSPEHSAALRKILQVCKRVGIPAGVLAATPEAIRQGMAAGYDAIAAGSDLDLLLNGARGIVASACEARGAIRPDEKRQP